MRYLKIALILLMPLWAIGQETVLTPPSVKIDSQEIIRNYFFDDQLQINDSTSLVLFIEDPQTQMASELGDRIYTDTAFIRFIKNKFYQELEIINGFPKTEVVDFCGHDMYFYSLSGNKLRFLNKLNSNCELSKINGQDISVLFQSGNSIKVDTLSRLPRKYRKSKDELFNDNVILTKYENTPDWDICKNSRLPKFYYDGYIKTNIVLDTLHSVKKNIEFFIKQYSDEFDSLNWDLWSYQPELILFELEREQVEVELFIYLKKDLFNQFKTFQINPIKPRLSKKNKLLIFSVY